MKKSLLYEGRVIERQPPANYEEMIEGKEKFILLKETLEPVYELELNNVYVSPYGIVFKNGRVIKESVYSMLKDYNHNLTFYKKILMGKVRRIKGNCLVAHNLYYNNYYHWTMEALPRIFSIKDKTKGLKMLIPKGAPLFVHEYLKFFDFEDIIEISENELVKVDTLVLPMHLAPGLRHNPKVIGGLADYLISKVGERNETWPQKIWVSRENARYRQSPDEKLMIEMLKERGYENIRLEDWNLKDQIKLFSGLKVLSGIHGAGFTNLMYMKEGEKIYDFIHEMHPDDAFYNLSDIYKIPYFFIQCKGTGKQTYLNNDDLYLNTKRNLTIMG